MKDNSSVSLTKIIVVVATVVITGACFRWEVREVDDLHTGKPITRYEGIAFPWQRCGVSGMVTPVKFHIHQWLCYGLVSIEATGSAY